MENKAGLTGQTFPRRRILGHWPYPAPEELAETEPVTLDYRMFLSFTRYPHHELAKLGRHGRTNFSMSRLRSAGSPARSCCRGGKAVSLLSKEPSSLVLLVRATGGLSLLHNRLRREHAFRSSRRSMHAGEGLLCRRWGLHGWRARVADHAVHAPIAPKGVRPNMRILRPKG